MPRVVVPHWLTLRLGSLPASAAQYPKVEQKYGPLLRKRAHDTHEPGVPVSLRWAANPVLGFPRRPFEVWRRTRKEEPTTPILGSGSRSAPATVSLPLAVIEIRFEAAPGVGGLTVEALGQSGAVLPGQRLTISTPGGARFRAPGIAGLRLSGAGTITNVGALVQSDWANLRDWVRIEVVGFPFDTGKLPVKAYDPGVQGWEVPSMPGPDAAQLRLGVAQLLQPDPPPPGAGLTAVAWPFPDPAAFLGALSSLGTLDDIADCLINSDDTDTARLQGDHVVSRSLPGLRQPGQAAGAAGDPATLALRTTYHVALAVQDAPVALGLGFGTIDVPPTGQFTTKPDLMPPGTELGRDEYLVTAGFVTPWGPYDVAAIGHREPAPAPLAGVAAIATFSNRAATRDAPESAAITLSWSSPQLPAGAGVLTRPPGAPAAVFNTPRPAGSGGFQPYLTEYRIADDGFPPGDLRPGVTMPEEIAPVSGSATASYGLAPLDVHGRWGPWAVTTHVLSARPVQQPGVGAVSLELPAVLPATGPVAANCLLTVEVSWDWADRSPDRIELSGEFVPAGPPPPSVTGFQPVSTQAGTPLPLTVAFSLAGTPSIAVPPPGSPPAAIVLAQNAAVTEISQPGVPPGPPPAGAPGSQVRRYRIAVPVMSVSFATAGVLGFAVSARAAERVRSAELSAPTDPRATSIADPFPAPPPALPAVTVLWTALPDAAGRARTVLSWPAVPGASGYFVWEATETALSVAVGGTPVAGAIRTRAADLKTRVAANQDASLGAFSRLNETALTGTSIELELPGSADTLFAYRVASITAQNVESARSADMVLVGVPHRDAPGTPALEAIPAAGGVLLTVVPGAGSAPAGLRLHRVRREFLAARVGTMGPAVLSTTTAGLPTVTVPSLSGPPRTGWQFTDPVAASWTPYYYRCVAVGQDAPDEGVRAGDSPPSGVISVLVAPPMAPLLTVAPVLSGPAGVLVRLRTDLPFTPTPAGSASIQIAAVIPPAAGTGTTRKVLADIDPAAVPSRPALTTSGAPVSDVEATRQAAMSGGWDVTVLLPAALVPAGASVVVTAGDPLGRVTSAETG